MIRVALDVSDPGQRLMLQAVLERAGCSIVKDDAAVVICDDIHRAVELSSTTKTLVLAAVNGLSDAIDGMRKGVWGYILVPLLPGEAELMVQRAARAESESTASEIRPLAEVEAEHIQAVVRRCNGNRSKAAQLLGIGRNTLWRKLAALENPSTEGAGRE